MSKNLQLHIPTPCHEDWVAMRPEDKGRFCGSCCKTVVDFSLMSDREVLAYLAGPVNKVCGRFTADQLERDLMGPSPKKKKGWMVWHFLLAGLLFASKGRGQKSVIMGAPVRMVTREVATVKSADTALPVPDYKELPPVVVIGYGRTMGRVDLTGSVSIVTEKAFSSDSTKSRAGQLIADTLALLGMGKKEFALYPNPAGRGAVIRLSLNMNYAGPCIAGLYNEAGVLVQAKSLELDGVARVELLNIPASVPGGLYFVRLSAPGLKKAYTQKLIVQ